MFGDLIASHDLYPPLREAANEAFELLVSIVRDGQREGVVRAQPERLVALAAWAQIHGLALLFASGQIRSKDGSAIDPGAVALQVITLLRDGLSVLPDGPPVKPPVQAVVQPPG